MNESNAHNRPIVSVAINPKAVNDRQDLQRALSDLAQQDPTIRIKMESTDGKTILSGMGELHLEVICERILHEYKVQVDIGKPCVIYLETIREKSEAEGKYIRALSRHCMYGYVKLRIEPKEAGSGYQFVDESSDGAVPREFVEPVNLGIQEAMKGGILAGCEMIDLQAILYDGSYHVGDSNEMAFKIATSMAFKEGARKASPVVLEPVMSVEVVVPEDFAGAIIGDLSSRRGRIEGIEHHSGSLAITAAAPLAEMIGYATQMRSITHERAKYSMHFAHHESAPHPDESGPDELGVTANRPRVPKAGSGSAAAKLDPESV